jgi:Glycosyltransferase family 9 (heptosyltransferase)
MRPPVTICVLTFGRFPQLARRAIESIRTNCVRSDYNLVVGANAVCQETHEYLDAARADGVIDRLIVSDRNLNKCPMMAPMFEGIDTEYIWWFDDDSYVTDNYALPERLRIARESPPHHVMWGHVFFFSSELEFSYGTDVVDFVKHAPWYRGKEPPGWAPGGKGEFDFEGKGTGDGRWFFPTGGCWFIRTRAVRQLGWPDPGVVERNDDVLLAEAIRQQDWEFHDIGPCGVAINTEPRRGNDEDRETMERETPRNDPTVSVERAAVRQLILRNFQSPGDIVMLTAAVRDLHVMYPGKFVTDVRTACPSMWDNNPYITPLREGDPGVEVIDCEYPLIHRSNQAPYHFLHGFIDDLNTRLGLRVQPTVFRGDVHISALEKTWFSQVEEIVGQAVPFWIVVSGGKRDYTSKWWDVQRYQEVVDHFQGRILFVQVGETGHEHPPLRNVIDLRGRTDLRQLIRLVYHSQGVLCPVTLLMHLAAAVECRSGMPRNRPCVVVAGGREPPHWEAYPHHQFIHRAGTLLCCDAGGCWKSRVVPLGDGDEKDLPENCCVDVVGALPRCMHMITAADVIRAVEVYFDGGAVRYLTPEQVALTASAGALVGP